jgi:hypothetical protein
MSVPGGPRRESFEAEREVGPVSLPDPTAANDAPAAGR